MSVTWMGVKLWLLTVLFNAVLWGIISVFAFSVLGFMLSFGFLFLGYVMTTPLLLLIIPLVKLSCKIPYDITSKLIWLAFWLTTIIFLFFLALDEIFDNHFFSREYGLVTLTVVAAIALLLALLIIRKSFIKLNNYNTEADMAKQ